MSNIKITLQGQRSWLARRFDDELVYEQPDDMKDKDSSYYTTHTRNVTENMFTIGEYDCRYLAEENNVRHSFEVKNGKISNILTFEPAFAQEIMREFTPAKKHLAISTLTYEEECSE